MDKSQQYNTLHSLKSRLYKNLATEPKDRYDQYEKKLLQPTTLTPNNVNSQRLIPKVALRSRLEPIEQQKQSTLGVTISQGRIIVDRSQLKLNQFQSHGNLQDLMEEVSLPRTSKHKGLAPLLNANSAISIAEESIIKHNSTLGGDEASLVQMFQEQKANKKKISTKKRQLHHRRSQPDTGTQRDYLTPMDFIQLIRTDPEMADEFCYLNKQSHPYDYKIVEFDERNPREYMTISARGITHFLDDEATFLTIEEWEREAKMFGRLKCIEFFRKYKLWKNFYLWKRLMRKTIMAANQKVLNQQLFSVDRQLRITMLEVRRLCMNLNQEIRFIDSSLDPQKHDDFKLSQDKYRMSYMDVKLDTYEQQITELVVASCQKSLYTFKEENRIPLREDNEDDTEERAPLLVGDETGKEMPYTQEATIRTHYKKLRKFVKLMDYIIIDSKLSMMTSCTDLVVSQVRELNNTYLEQRGQAKKYLFRGSAQSWIIVEAINKADVIYFNPNRDIFKKLFEELIAKAVSRICTKNRELIAASEIQPYIQSENDEPNSNQDPIDIKSIIYMNELFNNAHVNLRKELDQAYTFVEEYADILKPYLQWYQQNTIINIVQAFQTKEIDEFRNAVSQYKEQDGMFQSIEPTMEIGIVLFDNSKLKERIKNSAANCQIELYRYMPELNYEKAVAFSQQAQHLHSLISVLPSTVDQFVAYMENVNIVNAQLENLNNQGSEITAMSLLIEELKIKVQEKYKQKFSEVNSQLGTLRKKVEDAMASYDQNLNRFKKDMEKLVPQIDLKVRDLADKLSELPLGSVQVELNKVVVSVLEIRDELKQLADQSKKLNEYQIALQMEYTQFDKLEAFENEFATVEKLWCGRKEWVDSYSKWQNQQLQQVEVDEMNNVVERLQKAANYCVKELEMNDMAKKFKSDIEQFKHVMQVVISLRDPALTEKEWEEIRQLIAVEIQLNESNLFTDLNDPKYTVNWIEQVGLVHIKDKLAEIALKASKEVELVKMLKQVESVWFQSQLIVIPYKDNKEISILGNNEDLIAKIDDTLLTVNNILASRFVEGIRPRVEIQLKLLRYFQELLDEWLLHQRNWLYLEPILNSPYSAKNLVKETKMFQQADSQWKKMMKIARDNPTAKRWADDHNNRQYLNMLRGNNNNFDLIQKALDDFLEKKREVFQRFFFLSNDGLLEILSQAKNLQSVQPFLRKCFENIVKLQFDHGDNVIGMISEEGEVVPLRNYQARGSEVEEWLKSLEEQMKYSLKVVMRNAFIKYEQENTVRKQWVLEYPLQVVVSLDSVFWTKMTEENYLAADADGDLDDWFDSNVAMLDELTGLIRGELTDLQRRTLVALVTQDVHFRDIIDNMRNESVEGIMDFKWQQQLRFYYEEESIHAKQVNAKLMYGYEYLGSTTRLVITPLTDRCWMTITGALGIKLGAAPQGPAGTGKTESCKDLAKALGRYCIVFNCSDQITAKMMEKLFTGLAFCGAWVCLDEFNRIYIEVLSVIAQQVQTIREALLDVGRSQFMFFGKQVNLNPSLGIFITMNPGYAGRTELPDNLKVLFRPVAMMVPDYRLIAEIMLFAEGFSNAKELSRKMTKLYKLSSEQLSQQDHYDFGMRAVKSLLVMAGSLKRAEASLSEDVVLVRAMREANVPKFLSHDIPLFNAIVSDLFPGLIIPVAENKELQDTITTSIEIENFVPAPSFVEKVVQLHETLKVRFGVMLVGPTLGGKTSCLNILRSAYIRLFERYRDDYKMVTHPVYQNIEMQTLNPKAISMEELYGQFDIQSQQWTDGLASNIMRSYASSDSLDKKWVVFDGPVDALWIENMNTVLDDSMTLCLSNGERVKLKAQMRMLFEVLDLAVASPATVSRCGMVYIDSQVVGYQAIVNNQCATELREHLADDLITHLQALIQQAFKKSINNVKKRTKQYIGVSDVQMAITIVRTLKMVLLHYNAQLKSNLKEELNKKHLEKIFLWVFAWAVGGTLASESAETFEKIMAETFPVDTLPRGSAFDYVVDITKTDGKVEVEYRPWDEMIEDFTYVKGMSYFDMVVQTKDTVSYGWFLERVVFANYPLFITGVTGTGKTIMINSTIERMTNEVSVLGLTFSAKTSSLATQASLEQKLQTQRKKGRTILMPPPGKKLVMFVDDINMPATEQYGAQPPIELMRQFIDFKGVYDRKTFQWKDVENTVLVCACGPPGGGRSPLTPRFTRHFTLMSVPNSSDQTLQRIFSTIIRTFLKGNNFKAEVLELAENNSLVNATLQIYNEIQRVLLPTPNRSHYVFNLRDVSKVFQGLLLAKPMIHVKQEQMARLWIHETSRVFLDRLIDENDQSWFKDQLMKTTYIYYKIEYKAADIFDSKPPLIFADFMKRGVELKDRIYDEVKDYQALLKVINEYMQEATKMHLVLFKDAVEHLSRIARVLRFERGHYMLVGVGGSGKKSLTALAAVLAGCTLDTIETKKNYGKKDFKEDLFRMMCRVAIDNERVAFSFADTQIIQESFLEDVNNLLNSGEVPNMLTKEDMDIINNGLSNEVRERKISDVYGYFVSKVRAQLHVVLGMSPIGGQLRVRLRMFPSLVNCCTIEWLQKWPEEALMNVASMFLENLEFDGLTPEVRHHLCQLCVYVHQTVEESCTTFAASLKRNVYVTPKSYLDLIESYKELLKMKKEELQSNKTKLSSGLHKLHEANAIISDLKAKLTDLAPVLKQKTIEQEALIKKLEVESFDANKVKQTVQEEERQVNEKANSVKVLQTEANNILKAALPTLQAAQDALNTLNRNDISEIKSNNNPHAVVKFTLECVAILLDEKPDWDNIKKNLADPNFLSRMKNLQVSSIKEKTQQKIKQKIASNPSFVPSEVQKVNFAAKSMCEWVRAVSEFTDVNKDIEKKKAQVDVMNAELDKFNVALQVKQAELAKAVKQVSDLEALYAANKKEKDRLDADIKTTEERLGRAEELTVGLADEQERWKDTVQVLGEEIKLLMGNVFLAGATISYLGPFTGLYRQLLVSQWLEKAEELEIPHHEKYSFENVMGDPVIIQNWQSKGLPSDSVSISNGIVSQFCRSFPLFIDPQTQANRWIKMMYQEAGIKTIKITQEGLLKNVENAIRQGMPLLIEDVGEVLEPVLEPLLLKQFTIMNRRKLIKLGDTNIEYDPNFKLFMSTKLSNPNFLPDVFIRVTVINFTVTEQGLEDQLLGDVVSMEKPEVEATKQHLIHTIAKGKMNLKRNEERILELLANSKGMILDNIDLIENLKLSKIESTHVKQNLVESEEKSLEIEEARSKYKPVATRGSILYFVIADFALIDPMYQFSLNYFKRLFRMVIENSEKSEDIETRIKTLLSASTETIYLNVCRGLFNAHKQIFSFLITLKLQINAHQVTLSEWNLFVRGPSLAKQAIIVPKEVRLTDKQWNAVTQIEKFIPGFSGSLQRNWKDWEMYLQTDDPWSFALPEVQVTPFQRLLVVKTLREEETRYCMSYYVDAILGKKFTSNNPPSFDDIYNDTDQKTPLIFILSVGADPLSNLLRFANAKKITNITTISLGQGQGVIADRAIDTCSKNGGWVVLQNCHLGKSFMPQLEKRIESFEDPEVQASLNPQFRLILTSMPCDYFPVAVLQNGVKLTTEPPKGLKSNMYKSYSEMPPDYFEGGDKPIVWKKLLFSLAFFHGVVQERRKFGPLGWNIKYEFNDSDFETSYTLLRNFLDLPQDIPWEALNYVIGEITYGGRVTDDWDRRCLLTILSKFLNEEVLNESYQFSESSVYAQVQEGDIDHYKSIIDAFPNFEKPEVFGMNDNANITFKLTESKQALNTILSIQPRDPVSSSSSSKEKTPDQMVEELCDILQSQIPAIIKDQQQTQQAPDASKQTNVRKQQTKTTVVEIDSLRVCVQQEATRFNTLLQTVQNSIINLRKAIKGEVVMSGELDSMYQSLLNNQVPLIWVAKSYPSLKPLASYFQDMVQRVNFFKAWYELDTGIYPKSYWLSAFFFPQGFLTSVLQTYSRKNQIPIDILGFSFKFLNFSDHEQIMAPPENGAYIYGLFVEGTRFDLQKMILDDSHPGVTITSAPVIHFNPTENYKPDPTQYSMPLYKTNLRAGTLSTTGHSTNFIIAIECPTKKTPDYWTLNGAAFITQVND